MKKLLFLLLLPLTLFTFEINNSLLKVHATLFPKMILMDYNFEKKLCDETIVLALIYDQQDQKSAQLLKDEIEAKYHNRIYNHPLKIVLSSYKDALSKQLHATSYYLFPSYKKSIKALITLAAQEHSLTFTYRNTDLKLGAIISTEIAKRVKPIINIDALKREEISLRPILLKISKIYYQNANTTLMRFYDKFSIHNV